jgi:hypothetical protein
VGRSIFGIVDNAGGPISLQIYLILSGFATWKLIAYSVPPIRTPRYHANFGIIGPLKTETVEGDKRNELVYHLIC